MSYSVSKNKILLTRGDTAIFKVSIDYTKTGDPYVPDEGDIIRFTLKKHLSDRTVLITKDVSTDTMLLTIDPEDTDNLLFGRYFYDMKLIKRSGRTDTFISDILELTKEVG